MHFMINVKKPKSEKYNIQDNDDAFVLNNIYILYKCI